MRLLHVCLVTEQSPQTGMRDALQKLGTDGYVEFNWQKEISFGAKYMRERLIDVVSDYDPTHTFLQIQTADVLDGDTLDQIPGVKVNWSGDVRDALPQWAIDMAPHVDCTCFSNMRDVESLRSVGFNSEFLNIGFSPTIFNPKGIKRPISPEIVFMGNNYLDRFPCSKKRLEMVTMLKRTYTSRFAYYGRGWSFRIPWLDEPSEAAMYRGCKFAIDMNHYEDVPRFFSDRRLRIMASGAFCIANHNPGIEEDFEVGKHLATFKDIKEIPSIINYYSVYQSKRAKIAAAGCEHVWKNHQWENRITDLRNIVEKYAPCPS